MRDRTTDSSPRVSVDDTDAWIFDLDGVLTDTAALHRQAWTELFDEALPALGSNPKAAPKPFTPDDYRRLVDGEPRQVGVRNVLVDRGISLPEGGPDDPPATTSVWGLANAKDQRYRHLLHKLGPSPFPTSVDLIHRLRSVGVAVAVVSASRHCAEVLELAGLDALVDARVDGVSASTMGLAGKPDPASFLEAARRLGVEPARAVVLEDALAGVAAGRHGGFTLVVGVDRAGQAEDLRRHGADLVVADLGELRLHGRGPDHSRWRLAYHDPDRSQEGNVETLCTLANGFVGTRGARPWSTDDGVSYPGTYIAGLYDRQQSQVDGQSIETESMVNAPNWLPTTFRRPDGPWLGDPTLRIDGHHVSLDLRRGVLVRRCTVTDAGGRRTAVLERRLVSMEDPHLLALELSLMPLNWSGNLEVRTGLDGQVRDDETVEDRLLTNRHLTLIDQAAEGDGELWLRARTVQSQVTVALAARCRLSGVVDDLQRTGDGTPGLPHELIHLAVSSGVRTTLEKVVAIYTSRDRAISEPLLAARATVADAPGFEELLDAHSAVWDQLRRRSEITVRDGRQSISVLDLHLFHLLQVASPHAAQLDAGLPARGLHGEGYRGHVFWDAVFVHPVLNLRLPAVARALLAYRVRRLPAARRAARAAGYRGALFPWQSGSDGREETPSILFNPRSGRWMPDRTRFERHVGLEVAFDAWQYWQVTGDVDFLAGPVTELCLEVARCFATMAHWDDTIERYRIAGVVGPDEFHDGYPWSEAPGVADNAYTNVLTAWLLWRAQELVEVLQAEGRTETVERLKVSDGELAQWDRISRWLRVPFHDGVISQFDGYERLEPLDLEEYRQRYGNIGRLDLILEAEGDRVQRYQVAKQADVLMLFYLFSAEELRTVFQRMGYELSPETIRATVDYYASRVTHGSSLSKVVHSWVLARADRHASWQYFQDALASDVADVQQGTTREGVHLGAMAGTLDLVQRCYTGLETRGEALWLHPALPAELRGVRLLLQFRGHHLEIDVDHRRLRVVTSESRAHPITLMLSGEPVQLSPGQVVEAKLAGPG